MDSNQKIARIAGLFYLLVALFAGFAHFFVRQGMVVSGDPAATVANIRASESLFRLGFVSDILAQTCFIVLLLALYKLFKPVNKILARLMVSIAFVGVPISCLNLLNQYAVLILLSGSGDLTAFSANQLNGLVMFFLDLHDTGYGIAHIFFGLWLFPLGLLVYRSGFLPKFFGIMLILAAFGYLIGIFVSFLFPGYAEAIQPIYIQPGLAEISFCLWLLIKGVKVQHLV